MPALNRFTNYAKSSTSPAVGAVAITPSDSTDLVEVVRAVTINVSGTLSFISTDDGKTYTTAALPVGTYPLRASRIRSTGTTATGITGWI